MRKLIQTAGAIALVVGVTLLPVFTQQSLANENPCDGPRNEFWDGFCKGK